MEAVKTGTLSRGDTVNLYHNYYGISRDHMVHGQYIWLPVWAYSSDFDTDSVTLQIRGAGISGDKWVDLVSIDSNYFDNLLIQAGCSLKISYSDIGSGADVSYSIGQDFSKRDS